jgi:hypothetical protein
LDGRRQRSGGSEFVNGAEIELATIFGVSVEAAIVSLDEIARREAGVRIN